MLYNLDFDISALIIIVSVLTFYHTKKQLPTFQTLVFGAMLWVTFISVVVDILCGVCQSYPGSFPRGLLIFANMLYFFFRDLIVFLFAAYTISLAGGYASIPRYIRLLLYLPLLLNIAVIAVTPIYPIIFSIGENNMYSRKPGIAIVYIIALYFLVFSAVYAAVYRKAIPERARRTVFIFVVLTLIPVALQVLFPYVLLEAFGITLCLLLMYMVIQRPEELLDSETGLLNDLAFFSIMPSKLTLNRSFSAAVIIVDDFNVLTGTLGRPAVGLIIKRVAEFLAFAARSNQIYRIAQNRFLVTVDEAGEYWVQPFVDTVLKRFLSPFGDSQVRLFARVLVIRCPEEASSVEELLDYIEAAESEGRQKQVIAAGELRVGGHRRVEEVKRAVQEGFESGGYSVHYQPVYSVEDGQFRMLEALVRLHDSRLGDIYPDEFIPIAEAAGLIPKIGRYVFCEVCGFIKRGLLQQLGLHGVEMNLSVVECMNNDLPDELLRVANHYGVPASSIIIEITETSGAYSSEAFIRNINRIRDNGFSLALDDFGTGYSTLSYIADLPFSIVKIDKSIVWGSQKDKRSECITESSVELFKKLGLKIIAEGIETEKHAEMFSKWGCEYLQGYHFAKPLPESRAIELIESRQALSQPIA